MADNAMGGLASDADRDLLEACAALSRRFGEDPQFSRAGGGNSSAKTEEVLYIKPSGVPLASMTADSLMPLAIGPLLGLADGATEAAAPGSEAVMRTAMAARLRFEGDRRPSVECAFHAFIPSRFVIHTHPTLVNALTCARGGAALARDLFGDDALWVPYVDPGLPLAREIARLRGEHAARTGGVVPDVTLLQNHGLIVAGDDPAWIVDRSYALVEVLGRHLDGGSGAATTPPASADPEAVDRMGRVLARRLATGAEPLAVAFDDSPDAAWLARSPEGRSLVLGGPLTPDQIVYAGSWPLWLQLSGGVDDESSDACVADALAAHIAATGERPIIVVVSGIGMFAVGSSAGQAETAREIYLDATRVGRGALRLGGVRPLASGERTFIETWEAEAYRRGVETRRSAEARSSVP